MPVVDELRGTGESGFFLEREHEVPAGLCDFDDAHRGEDVQRREDLEVRTSLFSVLNVSTTFFSFSDVPEVAPFFGTTCLIVSALAAGTNDVWKEMPPLLLLLKTT